MSQINSADRPPAAKKGTSNKKQRCSLCDEIGHSFEVCETRVKAMYESERTKAKINFEHHKDTPVRVTTPGTVCQKCEETRSEDGIGSYEDENKCPCSTPSPGTKPIKSFKDLALDDQVFLNITDNKRCGFKVPTPIQRYALPIISEGFDVMGCAQTGTGKTAAYLIPVIKLVKEKRFRKTSVRCDEAQKPQVLIVAPTRELAQQIHADALKLALNMGHPCGIKVIYGGGKAASQRVKIRGGCNILIGTPGRIQHFISDYTICLENTEFLVLDEADKMIDDGFRSDLEVIVGKTGMPKKDDRQTLLFSATFRSDLQEIAAATMRKNFRLIEAGVIGSAQPKVTQKFECVETADQKASRLNEILLDIYCWNERTFLKCKCWKNSQIREPNIEDFFFHVLGECAKEKVLIFVEKKSEARQLAYSISDHLHSAFRGRFMKKKEFKGFYREEDDRDLTEYFGAISFHADKQQYNRETSVSKFNRGTHPILVATNVAARGLDFEGVTRVINYHLPLDLSQLDKYREADTKALKEGKIKKRPVRNQFEEYIHRIGRTGRAGREGESISFFQLDKDRHLAIPFVRMLATAQQEAPEWLIEVAEEQLSVERAGSRRKGGDPGEGGSATNGAPRSVVAKEWDDSLGPDSTELWKNEL